MGLQGQLNDVGSDSIPLYLVALIATTISHLRTFLLTLLRPLPFPSTNTPSTTTSPTDDLSLIGSGLAGLILLSEQLSLNHDLSYIHKRNTSDSTPTRFCGSDCVVCLSRLRDGDTVRELPCRHVFHSGCFEGWIRRMNFNCPLCRSPVMDDCVKETERRVETDVRSWFAVQ